MDEINQRSSVHRRRNQQIYHNQRIVRRVGINANDGHWIYWSFWGPTTIARNLCANCQSGRLQKQSEQLNNVF
jgi:hypothetical protein